MRKIIDINNCFRLQNTNDGIYYCVSEKRIDMIFDVDNSLLARTERGFNYNILERQHCLYYSIGKDAYKVDLHTKKESLYEHGVTFVAGTYDYIVTNRYVDDRAYGALLNWENKQELIIFNERMAEAIFHDDYLVVINTKYFNNLYCYQLSTLKLQYTIKLDEMGLEPWVDWLDDKSHQNTFLHVIGVHRGLLWLHVSCFRLWALDIKSGELVYTLSNFLTDEQSVYFSKGLRSIPWILDQDNDKIYLPNRMFIFEFDINTYEFTTRADYSAMEYGVNQVDFNKAIQVGDEFVFTGSLKGSYYSYNLGRFSLKENKIIDHYDLEPEGKFFVGDPIYRDEKIYARDNEKVLHVFELNG